MAKTNKLKLIASLVEADIISAKCELEKEVRALNYVKAGILQNVIGCLEHTLSYHRVVDNKQEEKK